MSVLNTIITSIKSNLPPTNSYKNITIPKNSISFKNSILLKNKIALIAELKRKSPSKGILNTEISIENIISIYDEYASAMSILTEPTYFGGKLADLQEAKKLTQKPLLRKDFIIDSVQIKEARYYGASAFLLIVASLSKSQLQEYIGLGKELGMDALVEIQNENELEIALDIPEIEILGINNRNLHTLAIDMNTVSRIYRYIPLAKRTEWTLVAESGYSSKEDLLKLPEHIKAILMGTGFMTSNNPKKILEEMFL